MYLTKNNRLFIFPIILSLITIYLGTGIFVYTLIIVFSFYCLDKGDRFLPLSLFFILLYLLPYSLNEIVLGHNWGAYLDNNSLAAVPLYVTLPLYFRLPLNKKLRIILAIFLVAFLVSTVVPGFLSFLGIGGYKVRFAWTLNYFNSFLVGVLAYTVFTSERNIDRFTDLIMLLGIIAAIGGLLQYIFGFLFFYPSVNDRIYRLVLIPIIGPVGLFPLFIVPLAFALNQLNSSYSKQKILAFFTVFTILLASVLTLSRWGLFVLLIMILIYLIKSRKPLKLIAFVTIGIIAYTLMPWEMFLQKNFGDEMDRLSSMTSLLSRVTLWGMGLSLLSDFWLFGVGVGNTVKHVFSYSPTPILNDFYQLRFDFETKQSIHQFFLDWFINQGILAMLGLACLYYYIIKQFRYTEKYFNNDVIVKRFSRSIILSLIGLTLFWMQNSGSNYYFLFFLLGSSFAIRKFVPITHWKTA